MLLLSFSKVYEGCGWVQGLEWSNTNRSRSGTPSFSREVLLEVVHDILTVIINLSCNLCGSIISLVRPESWPRNRDHFQEAAYIAFPPYKYIIIMARETSNDPSAVMPKPAKGRGTMAYQPAEGEERVCNSRTT